jgi:hypothetical protein
MRFVRSLQTNRKTDHFCSHILSESLGVLWFNSNKGFLLKSLEPINKAKFIDYLSFKALSSQIFTSIYN